MKTSVELDDKKVKKALELSKTKTLKLVLDLALDALIAQSRRRTMEALIGSDFFEGNLDKMRSRRGRAG